MLLHPLTFGHHQLPARHHHGINCYDYDDDHHQDNHDDDCDDDCDDDFDDDFDDYFDDYFDNYFDAQENMYQSGASGAVSFTRPDAVLVMIIMTNLMIIIMTISIIMKIFLIVVIMNDHNDVCRHCPPWKARRLDRFH